MIVVFLETNTYQDTINKLSSLNFLNSNFQWVNIDNSVILPLNNNSDSVLLNFVKAINNSVGKEVITILTESNTNKLTRDFSSKTLYSYGLRQTVANSYKSYTAVGRWLVIGTSLQSDSDVINYIISLLSDDNILNLSNNSEIFWVELLKMITPDITFYDESFSQKLSNRLKIRLLEGVVLVYMPRVEFFMSKSRLALPYTTVIYSEPFDKIDTNFSIIYLKG